VGRPHTWQNAASFDPLAQKMLVESDNEAASFILDNLTLAPSQPDLSPDIFRNWQRRRQEINRFFNTLGYPDINVSQKTFPIPYLKLTEPAGSDRQLRLDGASEREPKRNHFNTMQAAMLMDDTCVTKRLLSEISTAKVCNWIKRDLQDPKWPKASVIPDNDFNPIRAYLGEGIAKEKAKISALFSKAGWTKGTRHEIALVQTSAGKKYIIAVFAGDEKYAVDGEVFPKISRLIYQEMTK
jgi:beta-lactamase class A